MLYLILSSKSNKWQAVLFRRIMVSVILVDLVFFAVSTEPSLSANPIFYQEEGVVSGFFLVDYVLRLVTITESKRYGRYGPFWGRIRYLISYSAILDAFATFPYFLEFLFERDLPKLTYLKYFRLLRILRADTIAKSMESVKRVLYFNREILYVSFVIAASLIVFTAILLYYMRPPESDEAWNLFTTMYFATLILTGQGGPPDDGTLPWYTKSIVLLASLFSVGMFAIPASMLTWGFEAEAARVAAKVRKQYLSGTVSKSETSSSCDDDDGSISTSDEEYLNLIGGGGVEKPTPLGLMVSEDISARMDNLDQKVAEIMRLLQEKQ